MQESEAHRRFLRLFLPHRDSLHAFIRVLVRKPDVAEDILQDVSIVLWEKIGQYQDGTSFMAWARTIAYNVVRNERRRMAKAPVAMDEETLQILMDSFESYDARGTDEEWKEVLRECMARLSKSAMHLVRLRYFDGMGLGEIASRLRRTAAGVNSTLSKARLCLADCMRRKLKLEGEYGQRV